MGFIKEFSEKFHKAIEETILEFSLKESIVVSAEEIAKDWQIVQCVTTPYMQTFCYKNKAVFKTEICFDNNQFYFKLTKLKGE